MVATGYDLYDAGNADICDFAREVKVMPLDDNVRLWFEKARTGQVTVNPYWPRGHAVLSASFFVNGCDFDIGGHMTFLDETGVTDPIGRENFISWIAELPYMLAYMEEKVAGFWDGYCNLQSILAVNNDAIVSEARKIAGDFFGAGAYELFFTPNPLYSPYATDFIRIGNRIIVIGHSCDVESMLHEALHVEVAKHRDLISAYVLKHGHGNFADIAKMTKLGYITEDKMMHGDDYKPHYVRVIEECIVRGISTVLAGGGDSRLAVHANDGFGSVPAIGVLFRQMRPEANVLGSFIFQAVKWNEAIQEMHGN